MRFFITFLSALLMCLTLVHSEKSFAGKKVTKMKLSKFKTRAQFLSFSQVARLPFAQRVQYLKLLRTSYVDIEGFQKKFHPNPMYFKKEASYRFPGEKELYAAFFGQEAYANSTNSRGAFCSDQCIYAAHIRNYMKVRGKCARYPFGCNPPKEFECKLGGQSKGWQCNYVMTGLSSDKGCVSKNSSGTTTCFAKAENLAASYENEVETNLGLTADYFGLARRAGETRKDVSPKALRPDDAEKRKKVARLLMALSDQQYAPEAQAQMIGVIHLYKEAGIELPIAEMLRECQAKVNALGINDAAAKAQKLSECDRYNQLADYEGKFNDIQNAIDQIYGDYIKLCDKPLEADVVAEIKSDERYNNLPAYLKPRETRRRAHLAEAERKGETPTHRNVLQKPQCLAVDKRVDRMRQRLRIIADTFPRLRDNVPPQEPPIPTGPSDDESVITSVGCPTAVSKEESNLHISAARCVYCAAQKVVHNSEDDVDFQDDRPDHRSPAAVDNSDYVPSEKWFSLVSTMSLACNQGIHDQTSIDPERMQEIMETYGHCDSDVYDWNTSNESMYNAETTRRDKKLVEKWSGENYWRKKEIRDGGKTKKRWILRDIDVPEPDVTEDFKRIYGVSYTQATSIFCSPENFKARVDKKGGYMKKIYRLDHDRVDYDKSWSARAKRTHEGRKRMGAALANAKIAGGPLKSSAADDLMMCMKKI